MDIFQGTSDERKMIFDDGPGLFLKNFSAKSFNDPLEACAIAGGLDRDLISNLTFNSNQYARGKLTPTGNFGRMVWVNILVKEMYRFLQSLLKMSLVSGDVEGYKSLWYPPSHINISPTCQIEVKDYPGWTGNYKSFRRFVQIQAATKQQMSPNQTWYTKT